MTSLTTPFVLDEMREEAAWRVQWTGGTERETTITAMAWYAREFDADTTVTPR